MIWRTHVKASSRRLLLDRLALRTREAEGLAKSAVCADRQDIVRANAECRKTRETGELQKVARSKERARCRPREVVEWKKVEGSREMARVWREH